MIATHKPKTSRALSRVRISLCLLAAAVLLGSCGAPDEAPAAPSHPVELASATRIESLVENSRGRVLVLNFWATWCPPCVEEMPELASFARNHVGEEVEFLSVSSDAPSTRDTLVRPFAVEYDLPFPVYIMGVDHPAEMVEHIGIEWDGGLPATFIFNKDGRAVHSWVGPVDEQILMAAVRPLLKSESD